MKDDSLILQQILEKYSFVEAVSPEAVSFVSKNREKSLKESLKKTGRYNPVFGAVLLVFFLSRRIGAGLSMGQSLMAVLGAAVAVTVSVSFGTYHVIKAPAVDTPEPEKPEIEIIEIPGEKTVIIEEKKTVPVAEKPAVPTAGRITMEMIETLGVDKSHGKDLVNTLGKKLREELGNGSVTFQTTAHNILRGQLIRLDRGYSLYLRVVTLDGTIVFSRTYEAESMEGIMMKIPGIGREVADSVR